MKIENFSFSSSLKHTPTTQHTTSQEQTQKNNMAAIQDRFNDQAARTAWSKYEQVTSQETAPLRIPFEEFNQSCGGVFQPGATLCLDDDRKPNGEKKHANIVLKAVADHQDWNLNAKVIYAIVRDGKIMKLGGTRTGMKDRWGSYLCGHCVPQRIDEEWRLSRKNVGHERLPLPYNRRWSSPW